MLPPKISVIVPVYKVEAFLQECIDSILTQTLTDFELILVNDGSPDNCGAICDANASRDSRVRVIHQQNQGVTRARANGVSAARGEFITFVDGDDTLPEYALMTLAKPICKETDVVIGAVEPERCPPRGDISPEEYREMVACLKSFHGGPTAKLFRRSLFDESVFAIPPDIILGEDVLMNIRIAYRVRGKVYSTHEKVYNYRENPHSVTRTPHPLTEIIKCEKYRLKIIPQEDIYRFLPRGLAQNLINLWFKYTHTRIIIPKSTWEYHQYLCSIMKYTNIHFGLLAHTLFYCNNPLARAIIVPLYRIINIIRGKN